MDQYLSRVFPELTRSRIQGLIEAGHAQVDGKSAKAALRLKGGELLSLHVPAPVPALPVAEALPLSVLHEDKDLVVVDKAAGMVVHPGAGHASGTAATKSSTSRAPSSAARCRSRRARRSSSG